MVQIKNPLTIVQQGGGGDYSDDVRFIDYDGTVIAQMSIAEAQALTELPEGPVHDLIKFDGWTHTLQEVNATTRKLDIGAMYVSADNPDQTIFGVWVQKGASPTITFTQDTANGVVFDWGDGSATQTYSGVGGVTASHTYTTTPTKMVYITMTPQSGASFTIDGGNIPAFFLLVGKTYFANYASLPKDYLNEMIISKKFQNTTLPNMRTLQFLKALVVPNTITALDTQVMAGNFALKEFVIPSSVSTIGVQAFQGTCSLKRVILPDSLTSFGAAAFAPASGNPSGIEEIYIPAGVTSLDISSSGMFQSAMALREIEFDPNNQSMIFGNSLVRNTKSLEKLTVPASVSSIGQTLCNASSLQEIIFKDRTTLPLFTSPTNTFTSSGRPYRFDFTDFTQVPSMNGDVWAACVGSGIPFTIFVPSSLESTWKLNAEWAPYADYIVGV